MANSYINYARSTNAYKLVRRANSMVGAGTQSEAHIYLGTTEADADDELANILNYQQTKVLNALPLLNRAEQSLSMVADTRTIAIPSDVRGNAILNLYYDDSTAYEHKRQVTIVPRAEIHARAPEWYNGEYTEDWPSFAVISEDDHSSGARLNFYGLPTTARTLKLVYQASETAFVYSDISNPSSTKYVMVPDEMAEVLALHVAAALSARMHGAGDKRTVDLAMQATKELDYWARHLPNTPLGLAQRTLHTAGMAKSSEGRKVEVYSRRRRGGHRTY